MSQAQIRQPMSGMVLARRGKRQQAATRARNRDESRVENGYSQYQQRSEPRGDVVGLLESQLQPQRGHQESQEHGTAIAHENFGWLEVPAQKTRCCTKNSGRQSRHQRLPIQVSEQGEEDGGGGRHPCAKTVHVVQDAERGGNPYDEKNRQNGIQNVARSSAKKNFEKLRVNAGNQQDASSQWHGEEQFDLMVEPPSVVENTHRSDNGCARQDAYDLGACCSTEGKQNRQDNSAIHRQPPQQGDGTKVDLARTGQIDHTHAKSQCAYRYRKHQRCKQRYQKRQHTCGHVPPICWKVLTGCCGQCLNRVLPGWGPGSQEK